jgi:amino acid adenylation domain-containing protein
MDKPRKKLSDIRITGTLTKQDKVRPRQPDLKIAVSATFTAEPLAEPLSFWMEEVQISAKIEFAPFNQVFQQLLDPTSLLGANSSGVNVLLVRLEGWEDRSDPQAGRRKVLELASAIRQSTQRSGTPCLVCVVPASRAALVQSGELLDEMQFLLETELEAATGVHVVTSARLLDLYPVQDYEDLHALSVAAIPYTPALFAALASVIARWIYSLHTPPAQVIVLDCDGMLWNGAGGEGGSPGVRIDAPHRALQEFFIAQANAGMILCRCSNHAEKEIAGVFEQNPAMLMKLDDFLAVRMSSQPKSDSLRELSKELGLGPESFVFVDSNPVECAEVRSHCPEVTVLELPSDTLLIPSSLQHFWAFDHWNITQEDRKRYELYRQGVERNEKSGRSDRGSLLTRIASQLCDVEAIMRALESRKVLKRGSEAGLVKPRNATEEILAGIWSRCLLVEAPGVFDNFFALGGNSLLAVQVISRVRQAFGTEMPLLAMFETPTIAGFAERVEVARRGKADFVAPPLVPIPRTGAVPVSYAQQRLWFIDQLEPGNPIYNIPQMIRLRGKLNVEALENSLNTIIQRHEALRTTFDTVDGQPVQVIAPTAILSVPVIDLSELDESQRELEIERRAHMEAQRPFDLARGPVLRASLLRSASEDHVLLLIMHHIVGDRWSAGVLAEELQSLYSAYVEGKSSPLADLPVQYADFAVWQRSWLRGDVVEKHVSYWKQQLTGAPAVLTLPTDRPRPPLQSFRGATEARLLSKELVSELTALSQTEGATLFMTLLAALQTLLSRYAGQEDVVVGSPIAGRNYAELEPLIGFFVNTLALRTDLSGDPSFLELLRRVKESTLNAYAHQDIPFEKLVEELQPARSLSYNPIFQVMFALQNAPLHSLQLAGMTLERLPLHQGTSAFDVSWFATHVSGGVLMRAEYNTDLFDSETIRRALEHFATLLEGVVLHPDNPISRLPLLTEEERQQVVVEWNNTDHDFSRERSLHQLVEEQVERTPDAPALIFQSQQLTYRDLNARANQLARRLRQLGVGPETLVAVCAERSVEMVVGLLGVMKAGGAYVPLDPEYPRSRLAVMLEDAGPPVLLTQEHLLDVLPEHNIPTICLDRDWHSLAGESIENPPVITTGKDQAYMIYTSGSTGKPKGVPNVHEGIVNRLLWMQDAYCLDGNDRVLQKTPYSFDVSVWEFFWPLMTGACLVVARQEGHKDPSYLVDLIVEQKITTIHFVPSMLRIFLETEGVERCHSLRRVICSGEALPFELQQRFFERLGAELHNLYGPTEAAVDVSYWQCRPDSGLGVVPIGKPIWNTQLYILDKYLQPVPVGVPGELHIGGVNLSRGYLKQPELTAQKFIHDPFGREPGARLYKTGDLTRFLRDGNIEYLGRIDHQVKLRGFRIELGEIETTLDSHPGVGQSVVLAREDEPRNQRLVAYIVPHPDNRRVDDGATEESQSASLVAGLRRWLTEKLPVFMVPSAFVVLDAMPLSPNGKINRGALPAPEQSRDAGAIYVTPRTPLEEMLVQIWKEVLHVDIIGVHDNFFTLGGHSLLVTQVVSRIRKLAHLEVPLRAFFEAPTIGELALRVEEMKIDAEPLPPLRRVPRDQPLPLSFAQQRLWFLNQLEPNNPFYNIPVAIRLSGTLQVEPLQQAVNEIIRRHEVLRTHYVVENDLPVQVIADELKIDIPVDDLSGLPSEIQEPEVRRIAIEKGRHVFNLQTGPVIRASLLKLGEQEHVLLLNTHHISNDGWSIWQFANELAPLYEAFVEGKPSPLRELPVQYADFAVWQQSWLQSETITRQLDYWKKQLAGMPDTLELPTDRRRPAALSSRGTTERVVLARGLADRLVELSRREGATLFMTLLAAFQTLLYRYTRQEDIVVGSPIANRNRAEIEDLIGFFVNTLVMRSDLSGNPTFRELIHRVREVALGAYANQDLPFEKLVEVLHPERELGRIPLFQVWFVLQNAPHNSLRLPGLELRGMEVHNGTAKFDLGLFAGEIPDGLFCTVEYSTDLFDASTIQRLLGHFRVLLEAIVEDPDQRIGDLPLLTEKERRQVIVEWNDTHKEFPRDRSLHEFIEQQVERTPDAPALVFELQQLTYRELNQRANQLAHRLRKLGVGPEKLVAICAERSVEMVVVLLGVMKAGGAYVPIDPDYPRSRLAVMLEDADPPVLLTQEHLLDVLPEHGIPTICLDRDWHTMAAEPTENPAVITSGKDQAYVIYTSGSTGKPKGVPNVHEGIVNRLLWMQDAYRLDSWDRVLQKTPYSFDVSVWEFFWPLMTGACLVVARPEGHKDPSYLVDLIVEEKITTMHFVPSMLRIFLETEGVERCQSLRRVICSGEALSFELQERFFERLGAELHNLYGPTEAAVDVSYWHCRPDSGLAIVPIGKPIWNTQLYVLDKYLQPVPVGVPGELHIGGVNLARGYLKQPELTAQKFIRDPFGRESGARLYKTGDLTRFLPDGNIEYLGRIDHQVKIRGFRIELGEIESTLESHPGVGQSVVLAREDVPGDKRLVAYVVADPGYRGEDESEPQEALSGEQVAQWTEAFDEAYRRGGDIAEATFNITGWDSSYTGAAIPAEEMRVWVETTVERIRNLRPKSVWEIGCGTGLLLFRLAPGSERYYGTDISQTALGFLQQQLERPELRLPQLKLDRKAAHEFDEQQVRGQFDAVVLNSVIQYFPDLDYLMKVLEGAVESVRPGGAVFVGDVRSLPLLEAFHTSVELFKAEDELSRDELRQRVQKGIRQEGELLIDPEFFTAVRQRSPQITHVEIQLKRGRAHNELTRFRYDVVLHVGENVPPRVECAWLDWRKQDLTCESLVEILQKTRPEMLGLTGVPNARLSSEVAALESLNAEDGAASVGELREQLQGASPRQVVEPEDLWSLEQELPYQVEVRASKVAADGCCDVVLRRRNEQGEVADYAVARFPGTTDLVRPWSSYANNPLRQRVAGKLIPQLRLWLGDKLPEYMMPSAFVLLDAMPLSANGKVNRKALPAPEQSRADGGSEYRAPQTPVEEIVAAIFADVLRLERVGIDDNFFELGGHSLSATQVVSRIRQNLHVDLPVRTLFESPTVAGLSRAVEERQRGEKGLLVPPLVAVPRDQRLPLSFAQQRLWVLDQIEPNNPLYNIPRPIRLTGTLNVEALETALNGIVARHEILRTTYQAEKGEPFQVIAAEQKVALPVIDLSGLPPAEREQDARRLVQEEASTPFDLAKDPMTRNLLLKMSEEDHVLVLMTHHIASDGWSTGILLRELTALYDAALSGKTAELPELPIQYADYAVWQRNWLQGEVLEQQVAYWKQRLAGAPPVLLLPTDRPRPEKPSFRGAIHHFLLPASLAEAIRTLSRQQGGTGFMTMLAAFQTLILHYTKQADIVLGTDLANRTTVQTEALIGFFVNLMALRTDLSGDPTFVELLRRVREMALGAYAHQDVPFDKLVQELQPERSLSHNPLVQVLFVQENTPRATTPMPGLKIGSYPLEVPSKFDMVVFVFEKDKGVSGVWLYNPDLFDGTTIARMAGLYQLLLEKATANPAMRLSQLLEVLAEEDQQLRASQHKEFQQLSLQKLKSAKRKAVTRE